MQIDVLLFDVFGTCVDWRTSIARAVSKTLPSVDPFAFADAWRAEYQPAMERIRGGGRGYVALDDLHRENLYVILDKFGVTCSDPDGLARAWERLDPWDDVVDGLTRLKQKRIVAPCSNGSIALMTSLARYAHLPWDCILGAEIARDYKPKETVYLSSCAALRLRPGRVMMVAAHNSDLAAAKSAGLATAFVPRPTEHGLYQTTDLTPSGPWDLSADNFHELCDKLS